MLKDAGEGIERHPHHLVVSTFKLREHLFFFLTALRNSSMAANKDLEDKLQEMNAASDKSVVDLKERIQILEKELHNANELLSSSKLRGLFFLRLLTCFQLIGGMSHASACTLGTYCNLFSNI